MFYRVGKDVRNQDVAFHFGPSHQKVFVLDLAECRECYKLDSIYHPEVFRSGTNFSNSIVLMVEEHKYKNVAFTMYP